MEEQKSDIIKIEAYHGTAVAYKDSILRTKKIKKSFSDNDWAGSGIYYFVDEEENELIEKCVLWSLNIKKYKTAAVIKNVIEIEEEKILNLTDRFQQSLFQQYRQTLFERANQYARKNGKQLKDTYTNMRKLDCLVINQICSKYKFELVKRYAYINFYKGANNKEYPRSDIPNSTIINLKNQDYIKEWSECNVK